MDLRHPSPRAIGWVSHYANALDQVARVEELGADAVWFSEHHLFGDGYLSQPLTFAAAAAARTRRLRIGTAILIASLRHPRHIAEQAAIVDLVSDGRLELGMGPGYAAVEFEAFGADLKERFRTTDAVVAEVQRLFASDEIQPPSVQQPIPLWLGYQGPKGARRAGRLGVGLLSLDRGAVEAYRTGLAEGGHPPDTARVGGVINIVVAHDPEAAFARLVPYFAYQDATYRDAHGSGANLDEIIGELRIRGRQSHRGVSVLSVDETVALVRDRIVDQPVAHVYFWASVGGMPAAAVDEHLELLLSAVRPQLVSPPATKG